MHLCFFAQRGIKVSEGNDDITVKQNGIDIPVNLKYTIGLGSLAGIYLAAGPDFYFDFEKKSGIDKKKAEVGINVGAGLKLLNHLQVGLITISHWVILLILKEQMLLIRLRLGKYLWPIFFK